VVKTSAICAHFSSPIQKSLMKLELEHQNTCIETFFYSLYMTYFSRKYDKKNHAVQVCISPFQFSTVNEDMKQMSGMSYMNRNTRKSGSFYSESFAGAVIES
jgi:hypothetical protein